MPLTLLFNNPKVKNNMYLVVRMPNHILQHDQCNTKEMCLRWWEFHNQIYDIPVDEILEMLEKIQDFAAEKSPGLQQKFCCNINIIFNQIKPKRIRSKSQIKPKRIKFRSQSLMRIRVSRSLIFDVSIFQSKSPHQMDARVSVQNVPEKKITIFLLILFF